MKVRERMDRLRLVLQDRTALNLSRFQVLKRLERTIGDGLIAQWPDAFTWLQLGRIRRQEEQVDPLGDDQVRTAVPPRSI